VKIGIIGETCREYQTANKLTKTTAHQLTHFLRHMDDMCFGQAMPCTGGEMNPLIIAKLQEIVSGGGSRRFTLGAQSFAESILTIAEPTENFTNFLACRAWLRVSSFFHTIFTPGDTQQVVDFVAEQRQLVGGINVSLKQVHVADVVDAIVEVSNGVRVEDR